MLRQYTPTLLRHRDAAFQVKNVLSKVLLCRTATLRGHIYRCPNCDAQTPVYNSCADRHCPQCGGAKRAEWLEKICELILPDLNYFQVVFTLTDKLSGLILGNRRELYNNLFQSAWYALDTELRKQHFSPAAHLVLHTWNQQLDHHPHIHALVPAGGPSLDGKTWVTTTHPTQKNRKKPYLTDNVELGRVFRERFINNLRRLIEKEKLRLEKGWAWLKDETKREEWLKELESCDWNVFVEGPPHGQSQPEHVVKYLARYMSGGPIADSRLISCTNPTNGDDGAGTVTFWARGKDEDNKREPYTLEGPEFVRRWTMHILPKGYTRSRSYGGYHGKNRRDYLTQCRQLLGIDKAEDCEDRSTETDELPEKPVPKCARCDIDMQLIETGSRPSWREIFEEIVYRERIYCPLLHIVFRLPAIHSIGGYG